MNRNISAQSGAIYKRHSLLKRNPRHSREWFSQYYEANHGPLAASQAGFRKFSIRYIQNHVETSGDGADPMFDGITMTTQLPREDYTRGFFNEPDYDKVKQDELYLFDLTRTVSVLGREETAIDGPLTPFKALILSTSEQIDGLIANIRPSLHRLVINRMETATASALGFQGAKFQYDVLAEAWFQDDAARRDASEANAWSAAPGAASAPVFFPVREVLIFGPEKPWQA